MIPTMTTGDVAPKTRAPNIFLAGFVAIVVAVLSNTVVAQVALAAGASEDLTALTFPAYSSLTVAGVIAGLIGWLLIRRRVNAATTLLWLVPTVLALSWVPDVLLGFSDRAGVSWGAVIALMVMHLVVTIAAVATFWRLLPVPPTAAT